jgi:hypothetical protein
MTALQKRIRHKRRTGVSMQKMHIFMINSMLNHVALLKPPLPQLNVDLVSWYVTKRRFGAVYNIELGGGDKVCFVNVQ